MTTKRPKKTARKPKPVADYVLPPGKALVLRTCKADLSSNAEEANGFKWPKAGPVKCDDWQPTKECGHGLHGLLWGEGAGELLNWDAVAVWVGEDGIKANTFYRADDNGKLVEVPEVAK